MDEYIAREAMQLALHKLRLHNVYREIRGDIYEDTIALAFCSLAEIPAADVAPVVHGHWIKEWSDAAGVEYCCSRCAAVNKNGDSYYCPSCGAKMDEKEADTKEATND